MSEPAGQAATAAILLILGALAGPVLTLAPLGMTPLLIVSAILATGAHYFAARQLPALPKAAAIALGILLLWCAASLAWGIDPKSGASKLADITAILVSMLALLGLSTALTDHQRDRIALGLAGGLAVGLLLLVVETMFDYPLHRLVMGNGNPRLVDLLESKRSVDALPTLVWPAAVGLVRLGKRWLAAILALAVLAACTRWTASSATLGMAFSIALLPLALLSPRWGRRFLLFLTAAAFISIIPVSLAAYSHGGATAHWLKRSAQHRVEIWHFAAERALDRPLFGHGLNASRAIPNGGEVSAFLPPDKPIIPLHPHDAFLQIWLELGAVGAVLAFVPLLLALRAVGNWPRSTQSFWRSG
jgi:O-antigen ligase